MSYQRIFIEQFIEFTFETQERTITNLYQNAKNPILPSLKKIILSKFSDFICQYCFIAGVNFLTSSGGRYRVVGS